MVTSPGSADATVHRSNPIVNDLFTLGNIVSLPQSLLQSIKGRTVLRTAASYTVLPAYIVSSFAYTYQSRGSLLPSIAGAAFTTGSLAFTLSSIRTDLTNRRPVPRTNEAIAAVAEADARWGMSDRVALGIGFGAGMGLFAWPSLSQAFWDDSKPTDDLDEGVRDMPAIEENEPPTGRMGDVPILPR